MYRSPITRKSDFTAETPWSMIGSNSQSRGYKPRDWVAQPLGSVASAVPFPDHLRIDESEWVDRIRERDEKRNWLRDLRRAKAYKAPHQSRTNYCWSHGAKNATQLKMAQQGNPFVQLSAASVAAPIVRFANKGGLPNWAVEYAAEHGFASVRTWPENSRSQQHDNAESRAERRRYRPLKWYDIQRDDFQGLVSALLRDMPCAAGRLDWSHATCDHRPVIVDGRGGRINFSVETQNSWPGSGADGMWGDDNDGVLPVKLAQSIDDTLALVSVTSTEEPVGAAA